MTAWSLAFDSGSLNLWFVQKVSNYIQNWLIVLRASQGPLAAPLRTIGYYSFNQCDPVRWICPPICVEIMYHNVYNILYTFVKLMYNRCTWRCTVFLNNFIRLCTFCVPVCTIYFLIEVHYFVQFGWLFTLFCASIMLLCTIWCTICTTKFIVFAHFCWYLGCFGWVVCCYTPRCTHSNTRTNEQPVRQQKIR